MGELVVDWLSLVPGEDFNTATQWFRALGGNSANVAIGLGRLGSSVRLVAKVGADRHAQFLRNALEAESVDCSFLVCDPSTFTAQCYMITTAAGEHLYYNWPQPHAGDLLAPEDVPLDHVLDRATAVHTTSISLLSEPRRSTVEQAVEAAKQRDVVVSFDASLSKHETVRAHTEKMMRAADILKFNEPELEGWSRLLKANNGHLMTSPPNSDSRSISDLGKLARSVFEELRPKAMLVTLSARGSLVILPHEAVFCQPHAVDARSEVGAGDAYIAGVLHALTETYNVRCASDLDGLSGTAWKYMGTCGNITGAFAATQPSAYAGMPNKSQLQEHLHELLGRNTQSIQ